MKLSIIAFISLFSFQILAFGVDGQIADASILPPPEDMTDNNSPEFQAFNNDRPQEEEPVPPPPIDEITNSEEPPPPPPVDEIPLEN